MIDNTDCTLNHEGRLTDKFMGSMPDALPTAFGSTLRNSMSNKKMAVVSLSRYGLTLFSTDSVVSGQIAS